MFPTFFMPPSSIVQEGITLVNPSAEYGDNTGWTYVSGTPAAFSNGRARPAAAGPWIFWGGTSSISVMYQRITPLGYGISNAQIDAGIINFRVNWWGGTYYQGAGPGGSDEPKISVVSRNSGLVEISTQTAGFRDCSGGAVGPSVMRWLNFDETYDIPALTRYIDLVMTFDRNKGTNNDAAIDDITAFFTSD